MAELVLNLSDGLSERLSRAATQEAKEPEKFVLELLERSLQEPAPEFIGAWTDSDITPKDIIAARNSGREPINDSVGLAEWFVASAEALNGVTALGESSAPGDARQNLNRYWSESF